MANRDPVTGCSNHMCIALMCSLKDAQGAVEQQAALDKSQLDVALTHIQELEATKKPTADVCIQTDWPAGACDLGDYTSQLEVALSSAQTALSSARHDRERYSQQLAIKTRDGKRTLEDIQESIIELEANSNTLRAKFNTAWDNLHAQ